MRIGRNIKRFIHIDTCCFACSNVTNRISTGFTKRYLIFFQLCPKFRSSVQIHIVNLNILSSGDMQSSSRIFIRNITNTFQLIGGHLTIRKFYPNHLYALLPLSINTTGQTKASKLFFVYLTFFELMDFFLQLNNIFLYYWVFNFSSKTLHIFLFLLSI